MGIKTAQCLATPVSLLSCLLLQALTALLLLLWLLLLLLLKLLPVEMCPAAAPAAPSACGLLLGQGFPAAVEAEVLLLVLLHLALRAAPHAAVPSS
jgi:hypothetical protein